MIGEVITPHPDNVLNLVISGIPSILTKDLLVVPDVYSFKPCYKWNTFNTTKARILRLISGSFKPCYKWNTFNTEINFSKTNRELWKF